MRQFTMNIDDGLLHAAKAHALGVGRSVSDIVRDLLAREVGWVGSDQRAALDDAASRPVFAAYAQGRMTRRQAMQALNLAPEDTAEFVEAMNRLGVPWPEADRAQVEQEAEIVVAAIQDAAGAG